MGFSRQPTGLSFPSPGALHNLEVKPVSPTLEAGSLLSEPPRKHVVIFSNPTENRRGNILTSVNESGR